MILNSEQFFALVEELEPFSIFNIDLKNNSSGDVALIKTIEMKAITEKTLYWSPKNHKWVDKL